VTVRGDVIGMALATVGLPDERGERRTSRMIARIAGTASSDG